MISEETYDVALPANVDDEHISPSAIEPQPEGRPSKMAFFIVSIRLNQLMVKIIRALYNPIRDKKASSFEKEGRQLSAIMALGRALKEWVVALPAHLCFGSDATSTTWVLLRQQNVLESRLAHFASHVHMSNVQRHLLDTSTYACCCFVQAFRRSYNGNQWELRKTEAYTIQ
jgi:hypothetical protein